MSKYTVKEFIAQLRVGAYTSVGSYPIYFIMADEAALSFSAAKENALLIGRAIRDGYEKQWVVMGAEINYENANLYCSHSGERIESAYAEYDPGPTNDMHDKLDK